MFEQICPCKPGYQKRDRNCIPIYGEVAVSLVEQKFQKELPKVSELKKGHDMIFFQVSQTYLLTTLLLNPGQVPHPLGAYSANPEMRQ